MLFPRAIFTKIGVNRRGRDFVIGDLHAQLNMLDALLEHVRFACDRLIGVGDLIDRGPSSVDVLQMLRDHAWFLSCRGNHEELLRQTVRGITAAKDEWPPEENRWFRGLSKSEGLRLARIVDGLPLALEVELSDGRQLGVIHAEVADSAWPRVAMAKRWGTATRAYHDSAVAMALWSRSRASAAFKLDVWGTRLRGASSRSRLQVWRHRGSVGGIDLVISGHTISPQARPVLAANQLFIDTGAYMRKGRLTLVEPLRGCYWQLANPASNPGLVVEQHLLPAPLDFGICALSTEEQLQAELQSEHLALLEAEMLDGDS